MPDRAAFDAVLINPVMQHSCSVYDAIVLDDIVLYVTAMTDDLARGCHGGVGCSWVAGHYGTMIAGVHGVHAGNIAGSLSVALVTLFAG